MLTLLDFWKIQRSQKRELCEIKPFHKIIANGLQNLVAGKLDKPNLMILMPPRCGKTDLSTKAFVPWSQSYFPDSEYILSSYSSDLAVANSMHIRQTLASEWYRSIVRSDWGATVQMRGENAGGRQDYFHTSTGGSVKAVGTMGSITGFGAGKLRSEFGGCILIDDPLKAQDARSPTMRLAATTYIENTLKGRRNRTNTPIVLIMQRLHPQDPAGQLLMQERDNWHIIQIPALDENEQSIWEDRISTQSLLEMREANPELFWSQYMQSPSESAATIFKRAWWKYWSDPVAIERHITLKYITADTAFKAKDSSDWSVFQCWGCIGTSGMVLVDQIRGHWEFPELLKNAKAFWDKHSAPRSGKTPATEFWIEDKASGISLVQSLRRDGGVPARGWVPNNKTSNDKLGRANQCTMPISAGRIFIPEPTVAGHQWVQGFINEHEAFTADDSHLHDDQCDSQTMALLIWMQRGGGVGPLPTL